MSPAVSARVGREIAAQIPRLPFPPTVLGVAGCSGSGKTTLANEMARMLRGLRFHLDDYYLDLGHMPLEERVKQNFDDPAMIEIPLLAEHIAALARGDTIDRPCYDSRNLHADAGPYRARDRRAVPDRRRNFRAVTSPSCCRSIS